MIELLMSLSTVLLPPMEYRYLRPEGGKFVLESKVTMIENKAGPHYTSKTFRGKLTLTLMIQCERGGAPQFAEITTEVDGAKATAQLQRRGEVFRLTRNGVSEDIKAPSGAILTSAPDWSDVIEMVRRYDLSKKGKQEFAGVWFHPRQPTLTPKFAIELKGTDRVKVKEKEIVLNRFEIRLRASTNRVWALPDGGAAVKILPVGDKATPIVLEGYEEATRELK